MHESTTMIIVKASSDSKANEDPAAVSLIILTIVEYRCKEVLNSAVVGSLLCSVGCDISDA